RPQNRVRARPRIMNDVLRARDADHGNSALVRGITTLDMKRLPRTCGFVFGDAEREFTRLAMRRLVELARHAAPDVDEHEAHRTTDRRIAFSTLAHHVVSTVHTTPLGTRADYTGEPRALVYLFYRLLSS